MNTQTIEKYFSGETTKAEEIEILQYFSSKEIDPELIQYQNYFRGLADLKNRSKNIISKEAYEDFTPSLTNHTYYIKRFGMAMAVAASFALLLLLFPLLHKNNDFVVINGKKYTDKKHIELVLNHSLENVKLDVKQIFDGFDNDLLN
ncbi:MAG: hypothetical protein FWF65_03650 [Bacteroidetes bacterium]|nr:hypothetical protein [Bacteroidota bacterium]